MEISRPEKILVAMFQLADGTNQPLEYEDIVVKSWQLFPDEFGLRKYVHKYPDSSDQHKPLYGPLKDKGYVLSGNKKFRLTEKGISHAAELGRALNGEAAPKGDRLSRDNEAQLKRICGTDAFNLYVQGQKERILDTDFYTYLGVTVRTEKHEFLGQLQTVSDAVRVGEKVSDDPRFKLAAELHQFLVEHFKQIIERNRTTK